MAITGTHMLFYTSEAEQLRAMLRDVFGFKHVDAGGGWLIFRTPPGEVGVHPGEGPTFESGVRHQITFMCDDIHTTIAELRAKGVEVADDLKTERYGITTTLRLPGGCNVMMYQPFHAIAADIDKPRAKTATKTRGSKKKAAARPASAKAPRRDKPGRRATKAGRRR